MLLTYAGTLLVGKAEPIYPVGALRMVKATQSRLIIFKYHGKPCTLSQHLFYMYICMYVNMYTEFVLIFKLYYCTSSKDTNGNHVRSFFCFFWARNTWNNIRFKEFFGLSKGWYLIQCKYSVSIISLFSKGWWRCLSVD